MLNSLCNFLGVPHSPKLVGSCPHEPTSLGSGSGCSSAPLRSGLVLAAAKQAASTAKAVSICYSHKQDCSHSVARFPSLTHIHRKPNSISPLLGTKSISEMFI